MHSRIFLANVGAGIFLLLVGGGGASADDQASDAMRRSREVVDAAIAQARKQAAGAVAGTAGPREGLSPQAFKDMKGVDPGKIAAKYKDGKPDMQEDMPAQDLKIFVSTGMPAKALEMLGTQARIAGGTLVFRGLRKPLGTPGALQDMTEALKGVAATGANIEIDPEAFEKHAVTAVPTFVLTENEQGCSTDQCSRHAYSLAGDVTLEYALETWVGRGGDVASLAHTYLARMHGAQR